MSRSVFPPELVVDFVTHGLLMGALVLGGFAIAFYSWNNARCIPGDTTTTTDCHHSSDESCSKIMRARGTAFLILNSLLLVHAYNCRHQRLSVAALPIFRNQMLLWSVVAGTVVAAAVLYIPWLNDAVFKHTGQGWEWGLVVACCALFITGVELYKSIKRAIFLPHRPSFGNFSREISRPHIPGRLRHRFQSAGTSLMSLLRGHTRGATEPVMRQISVV
jgi:Na+-exporting ATPase